MYGVGSRLDKEPELIFKLRNVDHLELISKVTIKTSTKGVSKSKALEGQDLSNLFSIDLEDDSNTAILSSNNQKKKLVKVASSKLKSKLKKATSQVIAKNGKESANVEKKVTVKKNKKSNNKGRNTKNG
jgi:uncharacterized Zn finger protein